MRCLVAELPEQPRFLADVMKYHDRADDVADAVANRCRRVLDSDLVAIAGDQDGIILERNHTAFLQAAHDGVLDSRPRMLIDDRHDVAGRFTARAAHVPTREVLGDRVDVVDPAIGVGRDDAITDGLQGHLGAFLFLEDSRLRLLAIGDVGDRAFVRNDVAVFIADGARILEHDDFPAILAAQPVFEILDVALGLETREYALTIDRVYVQHRRAASGFEFLGTLETEHLDQRRVGRDDVAFTRCNVDAVDDILEQAAITRLGTLEPVFVKLALDGDACEAREPVQLVQLIRCRRALLRHVDIQRSEDPLLRPVQQERPGGGNIMPVQHAAVRLPGLAPRDTAGKPILVEVD